MRFKRIATTIAACAVLTTGIATPANAEQPTFIDPSNGNVCTVPEGMTKEEFLQALTDLQAKYVEVKNLITLMGKKPSYTDIKKAGKAFQEKVALYKKIGCPDTLTAEVVEGFKEDIANTREDDKDSRLRIRAFLEAMGLPAAKAKELTPIKGEDKKDDKDGSSEGKLGSSEDKDKGKDNKDGSSKDDDLTMVLVAFLAVLGLAGLAGYAMTQPPMIPPAA